METTKKINGQKAVLFVVGVALGSTPVLPASGAMVKSAEAAAVSTSSLDLPLVVINVIDAEAAAVSTSSL
ncbi:MAG: hypothetical protein EBX52_13875, partial [Proteobacteria bacterium]|nr:hypothetical protein [Pseudomonadota bacterium]